MGDARERFEGGERGGLGGSTGNGGAVGRGSRHGHVGDQDG